MKNTWSRLGVSATVMVLIALLVGCSGSSYYVRSAKLHIKNKNLVEAEKVLMEGSEVPPNDTDPTLWFTLGEIRFEQEDWDGMNMAFDKTLELSVEYNNQIQKKRYAAWQRLESRAVQKYQEEAYAEAVEFFRTALKVLPNTPETMMNLGITLMKMDQYAEAALAYEEGAKYEDGADLWAIKQNLLGTYIMLERFDDVVTLASEIVENADSLEANLKIAVIQDKAAALERLGRQEDAVGAWDALIQEDPENANFVFNKALLLDKLDRPEEASKLYLQAVEMNPDDSEARILAANSMLGTQRWETIKKVLEPWLFPDGVKVYDPEYTGLHPWRMLMAAYANLNETDKITVIAEIVSKLSE